MLRLTPLRTKTRMRPRTLARDQLVECPPDVFGRDRHIPARAAVAEEDEPQLAADVLLVALQRRPGAFPVDLDRLRAKNLVHHCGLPARQLQRGLQAER